MKINDNVVDDILKGLADYKPQAEPDWDAFYAGYKNDISKTAGGTGLKKVGKFISSAGIRNLAITLFAVTGIIIAYFLFNDTTSDSGKDNQMINTQPGTDENSALLNTTIIGGENPNEPANQILNSSGVPSNNLLNKTGSGAIIGSSPVVPDNAVPVIIETSDKTGLGLPTDKNENTLRTGDSLTGQPVLIKKTVIITDTVKITHPQKK
jgi:hypothetical protein